MNFHSNESCTVWINADRRLCFPVGDLSPNQGGLSSSTHCKWNLSGIDFVTRLKRNATYTTPGYDLKQYPDNILSDEVICLRDSCEMYPERLRKVVVCDVVHHRTPVLLTNNFDLGAGTIGDIDKPRRQIECFFKMFKQNFKIMSFIGTSENAVKI